MRCVLIVLATTGMFLCPSARAAEKEGSFTGTVDEVFRACADAAKKHYTVETVNKDELLITFRTGVSMTSWGMIVSAKVTPDGEGRFKVSARPAKTGNQVFAWGAGDRIAAKYFKQVQEELKAIQSVPPEKRADRPSTEHRDLAPPQVANGTGTLAVTSVPDAAEIELDGDFVGTTPATLKLKAGKHTLKLKKAALTWEREITIFADSAASVAAELAETAQPAKR